MRPHIRSCWLDGRACLCDAKPLRGVASHKGDRWDRDESRQVDELPNCDASTFCWESPARDNESAIGHPGTVLSGQCSKIGENRCSDSARDSSECIPSNCVINGMVSESQGVWTCRVSVHEENPPEVEEPLFFEWLARIEKGALIEIVKGVFGTPDSPCGWWKALLDTLQGDVARRNSVINLGPEQGLDH